MSLPIRLRLTTAYVITSAIIVAFGAIAFASQVGGALAGSVDARLQDRAQELSSALKVMQPGQTVLGSEDLMAQIVGPDGLLVESSPALEDRPLLTAAQTRAARAGPTFFDVQSDGRLRVAATPVARPDGTWLAVVATSVGSQNAILTDVVGDVLVGSVVIVALGGLGAWLLAGAALRPVERMRREATQISERDPAASLNVPTTGDEIASLAETINDLLARLWRALVRERRLVSDAAHELRTPLAILRTELELAGRRGRSHEELTEAIVSATHEVERLARLTEDLLFLARNDEGLPVERRLQLLEPILNRAAGAMVPRAAEKDVTVVVQASADLRAAVDGDRIRQAIDNLLDNAIRHTPMGGEVTLTAAERLGAVAIAVADTGAGFPPTFLPYAFERFRRGDEARSRDHGGSGLGLAIVQAIAQAHGGSASAANRRDGGAEVSILLPRAVATRRGGRLR